jgi:excisionase family DNA binding protein
MTSERLTLTVTEAAKLLGISRAMAYECVRTGDLPAIRLGGRILIPRERFNEMLSGGDDARAA